MPCYTGVIADAFDISEPRAAVANEYLTKNRSAASNKPVYDSAVIHFVKQLGTARETDTVSPVESICIDMYERAGSRKSRKDVELAFFSVLEALRANHIIRHKFADELARSYKEASGEVS